MESKRKALIEAIDTNLCACTHCGSLNATLRRTVESGSVFWHAECLNCGMSTKKFEEIGDNNETVATPVHVVCAMLDAITYACDIWNARPVDFSKACTLPVWTPSISPRDDETWTYVDNDGCRWTNKPSKPNKHNKRKGKHHG